MKSPRELVAAHTRHHHVNDEEVEWGLGFDKPNRIPTVGRGLDFVLAAERPGGEAPDPFIVVHDQHAG